MSHIPVFSVLFKDICNAALFVDPHAGLKFYGFWYWHEKEEILFFLKEEVWLERSPNSCWKCASQLIKKVGRILSVDFSFYLQNNAQMQFTVDSCVVYELFELYGEPALCPSV